MNNIQVFIPYQQIANKIYIIPLFVLNYVRLTKIWAALFLPGIIIWFPSI